MKIPKKLFRELSVRDLKVDSESRTIEFPFSSETPVERYFGNEILSHKDGSVDLSRMNNGAPLLFNHNPSDVIGVIESGLVKDGRGYARVRFSKGKRGQEILDEVNDGILRNVSVGYQIDDIDPVAPGAKDFVASRWTPFEVSIVSVPADASVGIGRAYESKEEIEIEVEILKTETVAAVAAEINQGERAMQPAATVTETKPEPKIDVKGERAAAATEERTRISSISAMGEQFGMQSLARNLVESGKSIDEARAAIMEKLGRDQKPITGKEAEIGLTEREISQFSFVRAMNALANPQDAKAQEAAKFEREVSAAAAKAGHTSARGIMVPVDVLRHSQRDLVKGTATAGGHLVATNLLAGSFIEMLRNKSVLQRAGAMVLNGLVGNIAIPRATGGATAYWLAESGVPTESQQAFDQVTMSPKTVGAFTDYSRKLLLQSSVDVEGLVRADIANVMALAIDVAGLYGTGSSNQPLGLKDTTGVNTVDLAGANPTFSEIVAMETAVAADNADIGALKYLVNAAGRGALKSTEKFSGSGMTIWESGNTVNGSPAEVSNQILSGDYWFGNFADLLMGFWSGLDLIVDPYTGATAGTVRVVAHQDVDVAVRHGESFCRANNTL